MKRASTSDDAKEHKKKAKRLKKRHPNKKDAKSKGIQPCIPRSNAEISSNWKALQAVSSQTNQWVPFNVVYSRFLPGIRAKGLKS